MFAAIIAVSWKKQIPNPFLRWVVIPIVVSAIVLWVWLQIVFPTCVYRYVVTAEVQTPEGLKTGSSVVEVSYAHHSDWGGGDGPVVKLRGDAIFVDLGVGKNLVVTLDVYYDTVRTRKLYHLAGQKYYGHYPFFVSELPIAAFGIDYKFDEERKFCADLISQSNKIGEVDLFQVPVMVTFGKLDDPNTVEEVLPDQFEKSFGTGYKLLRLSVQTSVQPITKEIDKKFPWWTARFNEWHRAGNMIAWSKNDSLINRLRDHAFQSYDQ